jgi:MFS family permease
VARFAQGAAAAVMMAASMALPGQAYPDLVRRARAVAVWAMGGAVAPSSGAVAGGLLTQVSWRLIFFINRSGRWPCCSTAASWPGLR